MYPERRGMLGSFGPTGFTPEATWKAGVLSAAVDDGTNRLPAATAATPMPSVNAMRRIMEVGS